MRTKFEIGKSYVCEYPFVKTFVILPGEDGFEETFSWRPGTIVLEERLVAKALGKMILTVVSMHKPGNYPERVFYTRQWEDPNGFIFGRGSLKIATTSHFRSLLKGYRHKFTVSSEAPPEDTRVFLEPVQEA